MWLWGGVWAHAGGAGDWVSGLSDRNKAFLCVWGGGVGVPISVWELKLWVLC